jgi:hypothetical protein
VEIASSDWQVLIWYFDRLSTDNGDVRKLFARPIIDHLDGHVYNKIPDGFGDDFYIDVWDFVRAMGHGEINIPRTDMDIVLNELKCVIDKYMGIWDIAYKDQGVEKRAEPEATKCNC